MRRKTRKTRRRRRHKGGATMKNVLNQREKGQTIAQNAAQMAQKVVLAWKRRMGMA